MTQPDKLMIDSRKTMTMWLILLKDPATGVIHGSAYGHNATGDYKNNPYYIGTQKIEVDMGKLRL